MRYLNLLFLGLITPISLFAQSKESYASYYSKGNSYLAQQDYTHALQCFYRAFTLDSTSANINYKIGRCYLGIPGKKDSAVRFLEKAVKNTSASYKSSNPQQAAAPRNSYYFLAIAFQAAYRFGEAISNFSTFRQFVISKDSLAEIDHRIEQSSNARMFIMAPNNANVINLGDSINSGFSDYNALLPSDESMLIFTSNRPVPIANSHNNIYISYHKNDIDWTMGHIFGNAINNMTDNISEFISQDGQQLFISSGNGKICSLLVSYMGESQWNTPEDPGGDINKPPASVRGGAAAGQEGMPGVSACVSPDGNTLYFVSDRPGGMGGKDIWRCVKLPNGKWSLAVNLGSAINTPYNEETPFMHADGKTFFFSSEGHTGMGGYDIFFTQLLDNGKWVEPVMNLGYPINTPDNETHFILTGDSKHGYFNSDRPDGKGGQDIYEVIMPSQEKQLTVIKGQILLDNDKSLPESIHIIVTDNETWQTVGDFKPVKSTGSFTIIVPPGGNYTFSYRNGSVEFYHELIEVPSDAGYKEIRKALTLSPLTWKITAIDTLNNGEHKEMK